MKIATVSARVPLAVKRDAQKIAALSGVSLAAVIRDFLARVAAHDPDAIAFLKDDGSR